MLEENGEDKLVREITNEQATESIGEKSRLLNNILSRNANWIRLILRRNYLLHDAIEGQMTEVKRIERRRRTQLLEI